MTVSAPPLIPTCRLYIDEVGHATIKPLMSEEERYLSLIGVACDLTHTRTVIQPEMEALKDAFFLKTLAAPEWVDPDEPPKIPKPIVFHRREMAGRLYPFEALRDAETNKHFDKELLALLRSWNYTVFNVIVDKVALQQKYAIPDHPYHYALEVMLERYIQWLEGRSCVGDVMAEARGGKEDRELEKRYVSVYQTGTVYVKSAMVQVRLSSRNLKLRRKDANITGLQVAELVAQPCFKLALSLREGKPMKANFNNLVAEILQEENKFYCRSDKKVDGYGRKWLP